MERAWGEPVPALWVSTHLLDEGLCDRHGVVKDVVLEELVQQPEPLTPEQQFHEQHVPKRRTSSEEKMVGQRHT